MAGLVAELVESIKLFLHHFINMKFSFLLILVLLTISTIGTASATANYSSNFTVNEIVRINQSSIQDPTEGKAEPWILWILSGCTGLFLVGLALMKPKLYRMDYEINIIISVLAWPFFIYWTWGGLTSVDYIVGLSMVGVNGTSVMITQHILYSFPILGWIGVGASVASFLVTILLIGQFKLFKEKDEEQKQAQQGN